MASFGENLRREREVRGVTLPELSEATKISLRHLAALEDEQFNELPGGVFNRGFVRSVARYLKLDEHHWVGEFVRAANDEPEIQARYAPPDAPATGSRARGIASFVLLVLLFGTGAYVVHDLRQQKAGAALPVTESVQPPAPVPSEPRLPANPAPAPSQPAVEPARSSPTSETETYLMPEELRLQVDVVEEAWVSVSVDGRQFFTGVMKPGDSRTFQGEELIELTTGNASAVILTLNGETLPPLGNPGERRNVTLTARDLPLPAP